MVKDPHMPGVEPDEAGWVGVASWKDSGATPPRGGIQARMPGWYPGQDAIAPA